jgi:hypothetical protein
MLDMLDDAFNGTVVERFTRAIGEFLFKFVVSHWSFAAAFGVINLPGKPPAIAQTNGNFAWTAALNRRLQIGVEVHLNLFS